MGCSVRAELAHPTFGGQRDYVSAKCAILDEW